MDILSHGLWAALLGKLYRLKTKEKLNLWWAFLWGMFPDLFAFTPGFAWIVWMVTFGRLSFSDLPFREPAVQNGLPILKLTSFLYSVSHSLVIFIIVLLVIMLIRKYLLNLKQILPIAMLGWALHILADIPTHSYRFYPTPFLWPISSFKINGFSWAQPWFMILNYSLMIILFLVLWKKK